MIERDEERAFLVERLAAAAAGAGSAVTILGAAGIGKTRLLTEARRLAEADGFLTLSARGMEVERALPFGVARQLLELPLPAADVDDANGVMHALYWLLADAAQASPLLVTVDDAHWADAASLRWLSYVANRVEPLRMLLLVASRVGEADALVAAVGAASHERLLHELSVAGVARLLEAELGDRAEPDLVDAIHHATLGNPFLVTACLHDLRRQGAYAPSEAPASVARYVERRLASLSESERRLLVALAVLEEAPDPHAAGQLAEVGETDVLGRLIDHDLVRPDGRALRHPLIRAAVLEGRSPVERAALHSAAARLLADRGADRDRVAAHVLAGAPSADGWAVGVLRDAAERAVQRGIPDAAARYLERALAEPPAPAERPRVLFELGLAQAAADGLGGADELESALALEPDPDGRVAMALRHARLLFTQSRFDEAAVVLEHAVGERAASAPALRDAEAQLFTVALLHLPTLEAVGGLEAVRARAGVHDDARSRALTAWVDAVTTAPAAAAARAAEGALTEGGFTVAGAPHSFANVTAALMYGGRTERARELLDEAVHQARAAGSISTLNFALVLRSGVLNRLGAVTAAEGDVREIIERVLPLQPERSRWLSAIPWVLSPLLDALVARGELEEAAGWLALSGLEPPYPPQAQFTHVIDSLARLRLAQGRADEAVALARECGERLAAWGIRNPAFCAWRSTLSSALLAAGRAEEAVRTAEAEIALGSEFGATAELGRGLACRGTAVGADGLASLREAVDVLADSPARLEHASALTALGAGLLRRGAAQDARAPLREALDLAERCGATALAERARAELVAAGARPRRRRVTGAAALTPSELRIASLAAEGLSNRAIAQTLFVTEKTVEGHLAAAFRKLGVSSRSQLRVALG
jgi:DNA-binding CsgD family transcriptional regulator